MKGNYENICKTLVPNLPKQTGSEKYTHSGDLFSREGLQQKSNRFEYWMQGNKMEEVE